MVSIYPSIASGFDAHELLQQLRQQPLSLPFKLAYVSEQHTPEHLQRAVREICCQRHGEGCWSETCQQVWTRSMQQAHDSGSPQVHLCQERYLGFVLPLFDGTSFVGFFLGGGLQETLASQPLARASSGKSDPVPGVITDPRSTASFDETVTFAQDLSRQLPCLLGSQSGVAGMVRVTRNLETARRLAREIAQSATVEDAVGMTAETLAVLFDASRVLIRLKWPGQSGCTRTALGFTPEQVDLIEAVLPEIHKGAGAETDCVPEDVVDRILPPELQGPVCIAPILESGQAFGLALLFDVNLPVRDQLLCDLILDRLVAHLKQLQTVEAHRRERDLSARLVEIVSELSLADTQEGLYNTLLERASELCSAESGSLMLLDESSAALTIVASRGMSAPVAKSVVIPVGNGIAGRVIQAGKALLVNDIEKDERVAIKNRPRFKTKSFLCLPLKSDEQFVGVLNLADKSDGTSFTATDMQQLSALIDHAAKMIDRTAILERAGHLEKLSITDPLTGLYNRRLLENRLEEEISRSQRQDQKFSVIMADLDHFKVYNDVLGHLSGDKALKKVAELMRSTAREMDVVTRYGGEEFCLVLPGAGKQESLFVAERLRRAIEAANFPGESHLPQGRLTISLGISAFPDDGNTPELLLHAADLALYRAKHNGRNRLVLYQSDLSQILSPSSIG